MRVPDRQLVTARIRRISVPYAVAASVITAVAVVICVRGVWPTDFLLHRAVVHELSLRPWHPHEPTVGTSDASPYLSPYTLVLGLLARITHASTAAVLAAAGVFNVVFFLVTFARFVRRLTADAAVPVIALLCVLLLYGAHPLSWSGYLNLGSVMDELPYPSMFAAGLMFLLWDLVLAARDRFSWGLAVGVGVIVAALSLIHTFTMLNAAVGAVALVIGTRMPPRQALMLAGVAVAGAAVALLWPYYSLIDLARGSASLNAVHHTLYRHVWSREGLAVIGLPFLAVRLRRDVRDPLVLMFVLGGCVLLYGGLSGNWAYGRAWPLVLLPLQLATAAGLVELVRWGRADAAPAPRLAAAAGAVVVVVAALFGLYAQVGVPLRVVPAAWRDNTVLRHLKIQPLLPVYGQLAAQVRPGDIVLSDNNRIARYLASRGVYEVAPPWPQPLIHSSAQRVRATHQFFAADEPASARTATIDRYRVRCVVGRSGDLGQVLPGFRFAAAALGEQMWCRAD